MFRNRLFYIIATLALVLVTALTIRNALAAPTGISGDAAEQASLMVGARYTAMALAAYERTGNRNLLPGCIMPDILALLPANIGDNQWRAEVPMCGAEAAQKATDRAALIVGARYTGLAIQEYVRTGNRNLLPDCIAPEVMALLPTIGDDTWRSEVAPCSH